jgi:DNA polymerase-3 subunit gamma/tau
MKQALYRKYRSKSLDEVVGQDHITSTLKKAIEDNSISHAYLFTGPKGVGKTSIARILAHAVNDIDYNDESIHLDIIEIDAASNRRIDEIRDLRDKVHISPTSAKYKVYIVDEVHMLTKEAFNALLKTLEEPPEHVIFILATTEYSKLPDTIISRTQHFKFSPVPENEVAKHLITIAESEGFNLDDEAAILVARYGEGSFRDSISLLDKLKTMSNDIDSELVRKSLGLVSDEEITNLLEEVNTGSPRRVLENIDKIKAAGLEIDTLINQINRELRKKIIVNGDKNDIDLYKKLAEIKGKPNVDLLLEIALIDHNNKLVPENPSSSKNATEQVKVININDPKSDDKIILPEEQKIPEIVKDPEILPVEVKPKISKAPIPAIDNQSDLFESVLLAIKPKYNTLYSVLRMSDVVATDKEITLKFKFPFHYKKINTVENIKIISDIAKDISGHNVKIICQLGEKSEKQKEDLTNINNIFGGGEMLES